MRCFVVPPLDGPCTGGTLYNRELVRALRRMNETATVFETAATPVPSPPPNTIPIEARWVWVDSLFFSDLPALREKLGQGVRLGLLAHYLPSLVERALGRPPEAFESMEADALEVVDRVLVPSAFLLDHLVRVGVKRAQISLVEPGRFARGLAQGVSGKAGLRAVLIGNLTPGKGVVALLTKLHHLASEKDAFSVSIVGSPDLDPAYAEDCRALVRRSSVLADRVIFEGALSPEQCVRHLAEQNLLVSSSVMESYGMALSEARTLGVPILARAGGNVASHVTEAAGGELVEDSVALAEAILRLSRDRTEHELRIEKAKRHAYRARSFAEVAREFVACERAASARL